MGWTALGERCSSRRAVGAGQLDIVGAAPIRRAALHPPSLAPAFGGDELLLLLLSLLLLCGRRRAGGGAFGLVLFLGFAVSGTWAMAYALAIQIERGGPVDRQPAQVAPGRHSRLCSGACGAGHPRIAGAAVVFFIFPRMTIEDCGGPRVLRRRRIGRPRRPLPGGHRRDDPRVALRVRLESPRREAARLGMHCARVTLPLDGQGWQAQGVDHPATTLPAAPRLAAPGGSFRGHRGGRNVRGRSGLHARRVDPQRGLSAGRALSAPRRSGSNRMRGGPFHQPVDGNDLRYVVQSTGDAGLRACTDAGSAMHPGSLPISRCRPSSMPRRALARRLGRARTRRRGRRHRRWLAAAPVHARASGARSRIRSPTPLRPRAGHCELFSTRWAHAPGLGIPPAT